MQIRDRIKELRRVAASELRPNPRNWRTHPAAQRDALRGVLAEVGYADALLARELPDGGLELVDGHLRAETTPDAVVPVLVLDITQEEANKVLLTLDPLAALAGVDQEQLTSLLATTNFASPQLEQMLAHLAQEAAGALDELSNDVSDRTEVMVPESYQVVVECQDEADQQAVFTRMHEEGYRCRVLTL
jgi:ParB-like chromosome segregation protein Spo0J